MSIKLPENCPRRMSKDYCEPLSQIIADEGDTFICCGASAAKTRTVEKDEFRLCFKSKTTDSTTDNDIRDLIDLNSVIAQAISVAANIANNKKEELNG